MALVWGLESYFYQANRPSKEVGFPLVSAYPTRCTNKSANWLNKKVSLSTN